MTFIKNKFYDHKFYDHKNLFCDLYDHKFIKINLSMGIVSYMVGIYNSRDLLRKKRGDTCCDYGMSVAALQPEHAGLVKLQTLFHLPLPEAARRAQMTNTEFRTLCTHLGVKVWPYQPNDTACSGLADTECPGQADTGSSGLTPERAVVIREVLVAKFDFGQPTGHSEAVKPSKCAAVEFDFGWPTALQCIQTHAANCTVSTTQDRKPFGNPGNGKQLAFGVCNSSSAASERTPQLPFSKSWTNPMAPVLQLSSNQFHVPDQQQRKRKHGIGLLRQAAKRLQKQAIGKPSTLGVHSKKNPKGVQQTTYRQWRDAQHTGESNGQKRIRWMQMTTAEAEAEAVALMDNAVIPSAQQKKFYKQKFANSSLQQCVQTQNAIPHNTAHATKPFGDPDKARQLGFGVAPSMQVVQTAPAGAGFGGASGCRLGWCFRISQLVSKQALLSIVLLGIFMLITPLSQSSFQML